MTVDEWDLRQAAKGLTHLYRELEAAKFAPTRQPEVQVMKPGFGPRPPAPDHIISLDEELSSRLFEYVRDLANHVRPSMILHHDGGRLASFVVWHAQEAADLPFAEDLLEEMLDQAKRIKRVVSPPEPATIAKQPERYVDIDTIVRNLRQRGHAITSRQAREVAGYQGFDMAKFGNGKNGYKLTQFLHHYEKPQVT